MPKNANQSKFSNYSMDFDGSSYIDVGNANELNITESITISAWVKASSSSTDRCYVSKRGTSGNAYQISQYTNKAIGLSIWIGGGNRKDLLGTTNHVQDVWYHVVGTYDGSYMRVYVNGVEENNQAQTGSIDTTANSFRIAADNYSSTYWFNGQITEVSIFDYALSSSQVTTLWGGGTSVSNPMALPRTPIAYYPLGTSAWDGNSLAENNAIGDYVFEIGNYPKLINSGTITDLNSDMAELSVSIWLKKTGGNRTSDYAILSKAYANPPTSFSLFWKRDSLAIQGVNTAFKINNGSVQTVGGQSNTGNEVAITMEDNKWYHIVGTYDGTTQSLYINGNLHDYKSTSGNITGVSDNFILGAGIYNFYNWLGELSNCMIWTKGLSQSEVTTLYNNGSPIKTLANIPQSSNLKAWYKLDATEIYDSSATEWSVENNANPSLYNSCLQWVGNTTTYQLQSSSTITLSDNLTVSMWGRNWANSDGPISSISTTNNSTYNLFVYANVRSGRYSLLSPAGAWTNITPIINDGGWHNIVISYNQSNTEMKVYTDGVESYSSTNINWGTGNTIDYIGSTYQATRILDGDVSNISIWNTNLNLSQAQEIYNNGTPKDLTSHSSNSNLVNWYTLDNTSLGIQDSKGNIDFTKVPNYEPNVIQSFVNSLAGDSSGMSQTNLVQSNLQTVAPYSKYAMNFDGASSDYIDCGNDSSLEITGNFTISAWVKLNGYTNTYPRLVGKGNSADNRCNYGIGFYGTMPAVIGNSSGTWIANYNSTALSTGVWYNIVGVYDGTNFLLYNNGSLDTTNSASGFNAATAASATSGDSLLISAKANGASGFVNGSLSNVSIWNAALTSAQVTEIYNEGVPSNLNNHSAYSNLVSWWQLGENSSFTSSPNKWICADEKGSNNGESQNMDVDALTNGVGTTANGTSTGMSEGNLVGDAPYSTANALSSGMAVTARGTSVP